MESAASAGSRVDGSARRSLRFDLKVALFAGFGSVLVLMTFVGVFFIQELRRIQSDDTQITQTYLKRHRLLDQIRSSLYLSSTFLRDYLLQSSPDSARISMAGLNGVRREMELTLREYAASIPPAETQPFAELSAQISRYWHTLEPLSHWTPSQRRAEGLKYLQGQVLPQRTLMLSVAARIDSINERSLADGTQRVSGLFRSLRRRVLAILGLMLAMGIAVAAVSITQTLGIERASRRRYDEVQRTQRELKRLSARLLQAQEEERRAISRELHDQIGQTLNAFLVDLGNLAAVIPPENLQAHQFLDTARILAEENIKALRNMALLLRPSMLDDLGLVAALGWQAREVSSRAGIRVDMIATDVPDELPEEHKTCVYRVVQEALQNAARHAEARLVRVAVKREGANLVLTIQDDGKGFNPHTVRGLGLLGMEERVKNLAGTFQVHSKAGFGALLTVRLPLTAPGVRAKQG
jgi:signal transduction histidine kinase